MDASSGGPAVDAGPLPHCSSVDPIGPVIADFDSFNNQAFGQFGVDPVIGSTFISSGSLAQDFTSGNWHIAGLVTGPVSFGLNWQCPGVIDGVCTLNLLRYAGLEFTVSGSIGPAGALRFTVGSAPDDAVTAPPGCGRCNITTDVCSAPYATVIPGSVVSPPQMWTLSWDLIRSGVPFRTTDPYSVTTITWTLPAATDGGSYPVDFTLDDIRLIPIPH